MKNTLILLCLLLGLTSCETYGQVQEKNTKTLNAAAFFQQSTQAQLSQIEQQQKDLIESLNEQLKSQKIEPTEYIDLLNIGNKRFEKEKEKLRVNLSFINGLQQWPPLPGPPPPPCPQGQCSFDFKLWKQVIFHKDGFDYKVSFIDPKSNTLIAESGTFEAGPWGGQLAPIKILESKKGFANMTITQLKNGQEVQRVVTSVNIQ